MTPLKYSESGREAKDSYTDYGKKVGVTSKILNIITNS